MKVMNATDLRAVEALVEQNDAAVVNKEKYRSALAFAYGCMNSIQRSVYRDYHLNVLAERYDIEYCNDEQVILPHGALKATIKFIKETLSDSDYAELKEYFQFTIALAVNDNETI
ncbi:hypothetical protein [Vibrio phage XZ1]|nr:hypothetical protein [Vibrio phage XZ1]